MKNILYILTLILLGCTPKKAEPPVEKAKIEIINTVTWNEQQNPKTIDDDKNNSGAEQESIVYETPKGLSFADNKHQKAHVQTKRYYMIVGSFTDYENAVKLHESIEGSEIISPSENVTRVALASFVRLDDAMAAIKQYREKNPKVAAWLFWRNLYFHANFLRKWCKHTLATKTVFINGTKTAKTNFPFRIT